MKRTVAIFEQMWRSSEQELTRVEAENELLREACWLFTKGAHDAVRALNAAGIACPASIALAAEKARNALERKP
jgi:hypothetical protein